MAEWIADAAAGLGLAIFIGCAFVLANVAPLLIGRL
jgi:hypothetical protein